MTDKKRPEILTFFEFEHLPKELQDVSMPICVVADQMFANLPECAELSAGLRKLLEAKDCFVRAKLLADKPKDDRVRFGKFMIEKEAMAEIDRCKANKREDQAIRVLKSQETVWSGDIPDDDAKKLIVQYFAE